MLSARGLGSTVRTANGCEMTSECWTLLSATTFWTAAFLMLMTSRPQRIVFRFRCRLWPKSVWDRASWKRNARRKTIGFFSELQKKMSEMKRETTRYILLGCVGRRYWWLRSLEDSFSYTKRILLSQRSNRKCICKIEYLQNRISIHKSDFRISQRTIKVNGFQEWRSIISIFTLKEICRSAGHRDSIEKAITYEPEEREG